MTTILLCVLLLLGIVCLILGIAYNYERWRGLSHPRIDQRQEPLQREEEAHDLVARSKGLTAYVIPPYLVSSVAEESKLNAPNFAEFLRQEAVHKKLLQAIREAESETEETAPLPPSQDTRVDMPGLDYYL